jgi:preprotein translocase subunit SecD
MAWRMLMWVLLGVTWLVSGCGSVDPKPEAKVTLEDGLYVVVPPAEDATSLAQRVVELETVPVKDEPVESMRISTMPIVRLREMQLRGVGLDEANACNQITFKNDERLKAFSRDHVGTRVAVVIGGKVISSHKIRVPLEDDEFQVTFCTEGGGDHLYRHLRDVYSYMTKKHGVPE